MKKKRKKKKNFRIGQFLFAARKDNPTIHGNRKNASLALFLRQKSAD